MPQGNLVAYPVTEEFTESMGMADALASIDLTRETIHGSTCTPRKPCPRPAGAPRPAPSRAHSVSECVREKERDEKEEEGGRVPVAQAAPQGLLFSPVG